MYPPGFRKLPCSGCQFFGRLAETAWGHDFDCHWREPKISVAFLNLHTPNRNRKPQNLS